MATYTEEIKEFVTVEGGPFNLIQVDTYTITLKDGVEIGRAGPHSCTFHPHKPIDEQSNLNPSDKVKVIARSVWTDEVMAAYAARPSSSLVE